MQLVHTTIAHSHQIICGLFAAALKICCYLPCSWCTDEDTGAAIQAESIVPPLLHHFLSQPSQARHIPATHMHTDGRVPTDPGMSPLQAV